jgi:hypothetical protein
MGKERRYGVVTVSLAIIVTATTTKFNLKVGNDMCHSN